MSDAAESPSKEMLDEKKIEDEVFSKNRDPGLSSPSSDKSKSNLRKSEILSSDDGMVDVDDEEDLNQRWSNKSVCSKNS